MSPRALASLAVFRQSGTSSGLEEAEAQFRRALEADPGFARAQAGLCRVAILKYERTGATEHVSAAEEACRAALDADPTLKETEMALGRLYLASGRHEQAEAVYRSLLRRSPRDAEVRIGVGRALVHSKRIEEAEQSFREAVVVEPGYWKSYNALGSFLFAAGRSAEAAEAYARVTQLTPGNPIGFNNLGAARLAAGQLAAAAEGRGGTGAHDLDQRRCGTGQRRSVRLLPVLQTLLQKFSQFPDRSEPVFGLFGQQAHHDPAQPVGNLGIQFANRPIYSAARIARVKTFYCPLTSE